MVYIELRKDNWFEIGQGMEKSSVVHTCYLEKQRLKDALQKIGGRSSLSELEHALSQIKGEEKRDQKFRLPPYIKSTKGKYEVWVESVGPPGEIPLGYVKE